MERDLVAAWHTAAFGRAKKLKPLSDYLSRFRRRRTPPPELTGEERQRIVDAAREWAEELNSPRG